MNDDPTDGGLSVLFRDERYVAVNKPAGLLLHRSPIDARETRFLVQLLRDQLGQRVFPVHRLDKPTQGVVILALDSEAAAALQARFRDSEVDKEYLAVIRGHLLQAITVDHPLADPDDAQARHRVPPRRPAVTRIRPRNTMELPYPVRPHRSARYSLVECVPVTGRRHQIRRHLKHLRHPIVGDANYGDGPHNRLFRDQLGIPGLLLAATRLTFEHPYSGEQVSIHAPLLSPMREALQLPAWRPASESASSPLKK